MRRCTKKLFILRVVNSYEKILYSPCSKLVRKNANISDRIIRRPKNSVLKNITGYGVFRHLRYVPDTCFDDIETRVTSYFDDIFFIRISTRQKKANGVQEIALVGVQEIALV